MHENSPGPKSCTPFCPGDFRKFPNFHFWGLAPPHHIWWISGISPLLGAHFNMITLLNYGIMLKYILKQARNVLRSIYRKDLHMSGTCLESNSELLDCVSRAGPRNSGRSLNKIMNRGYCTCKAYKKYSSFDNCALYSTWLRAFHLHHKIVDNYKF